MPLDISEISDSIINMIISPDNIIISNKIILAITITFIILLIFYIYAKDDIETVYEDSNLYEISMKSGVVSTFIVYTLLYLNNKVTEDNIKKKYELNESKAVIHDLSNSIDVENSIKPKTN